MAVTEVVIVGGGIAGLSAAGRLTELGIKHIVLEGAGVLGGRMRTLHNGLEAGVIELGAQWIHGGCPANSLFNYCVSRNLLGATTKRLGRTMTDERPGFLYTPQGRVIDKDISNKGWELYEIINAECEFAFTSPGEPSTLTVREFYDMRVDEEIEKLGSNFENNKEDIRIVLESLCLTLAGYLGDSLEDSGLYMYGSSAELPGEDVVVPSGLSTVVESLAKDTNGQIELNTLVSRIEWNDEGVTVLAARDNKQVEYRGDHVIVTVPLGVLQNNQHLFKPSLNEEKLTAISHLRPGRVSKVFLEFSEPFWEQGNGNINLTWSNKDFASANLPEDWTTFVDGFHEVEGQRRMLMMWVCGDAANVVDDIDDKLVIQGVAKLLRQFTGDPSIPCPHRVLRHRWTKDPLTRGAWSYPSIHATVQDYLELCVPLPSTDRPRLLLAGEHTHPTYWSFMHGARLSGIEQADKIGIFKSRNKCL